MGVLIDLNTVNEDEEDNHSQITQPQNLLKDSSLSLSQNPMNSPSSASSSSSSYCSASPSVCMELWHACAGPLISLPKKGSLVVYLPQGHLEQQQHLTGFDFSGVPHAFDSLSSVASHVFCRVLDVKLHAEVATDEVYAQVSLIPETQIEEKLREREISVDGEEEDFEDAAKSTTPHMFCKTLTASDTSTHGGFSVPRRAAEDCFPPLDYKQQRPSQELVAKDLHGLEWRFRHIYRGQPRRHLLTTGWSAFVNKKKLISGDAVLFLRGADGELRLGIRRAVQLKGAASFQGVGGEHVNNGGLKAVFSAISSGHAFNICHNPRTNSSEFIVPLRRFLKSLDTSFSVGMRFKMRHEAEDAGERRYTGVVTGMAELDPVRWSGSKWKCLMVRWDDVEVNRHGRVSPWEIEPTGSFPSPSNVMASGLKRNRIGLPLTKPDFPIPGGVGVPDFGESLGFRKVLQGQEKLGSHSVCDGTDSPHHPAAEPRRSFLCSNNFSAPPGDFGIPGRGIVYGEPFQFRKVLQGQETHLSPTHQRHVSGPMEIFEGVQVPGCRTSWLKRASNPSLTQVSSPSSVLMFQQASSIQARNLQSPILPSRIIGLEPINHSGHALPIEGGRDSIPRGKPSCRLFGFSLTEGDDTGKKNSSFPPPVCPDAPFWPVVEGQPCYKAPSVTKAVRSNCPGASDLYAVRDMLLDIAL